MHNLPDTVFKPKDAGHTQSNWSDVIPSANLGLVPLYFYNVCKVRGHMLRHELEAGGLAISVIRCGTLHGLNNLLKSTCEGAKRVTEGDVVSLGVQPLQRRVVSRHELTQGQVILLNYLIKIS